MIRVKEFADKVGCTPQNIYLHLKNYKTELEGHVVQGRRGSMLDEYAQDFIRSVMYPKEVSADKSVLAELNQLRGEYFQIATKLAEAQAIIASLEAEKDKNLYELGHYQRLLSAAQESEAEEKREKEQLEENLQHASEELKKAVENQRALEDNLQAAESNSKAAAEEIEKLKAEKAAESERANQAQQDLKDYRNRPRWERFKDIFK